MVQRRGGGSTTKRSTYTVSLPWELVEALDAFLEQHATRLGYRRSRADYIAAAIRAQRQRDEIRLVRMKSLTDEAGNSDWLDSDHD